MSEKFNSGMGGYICDHCRILLWAGRDGAAHPENRQYLYTAQPERIVERDGLFFCGEYCANEEALAHEL